MAEIMIVATIAVFLLALSVRFLHHIIGSPAGHEYETGRIFSIYGRFVADGYVREYNKENVRIWAKFEDWKHERAAKLDADLHHAVTDLEKLSLHKQYTEDVEQTMNRVESWRRPNPWMALGACFMCFSTWVCCFSWCVLVPYLGIPVLLWPVLVASTVMIAKRMEIEMPPAEDKE